MSDIGDEIYILENGIQKIGTIIKVCSCDLEENRFLCILLQDDQFKFKDLEKMGDCNNEKIVYSTGSTTSSNRNKKKRKRSDTVSTSISKQSVESASQWGSRQLQKFNIYFVPCQINGKISNEAEICKFFDQKEPLDISQFKKLIEMDLQRTPDTEMNQNKTFSETVVQFMIRQTEADVQSYAKNILIMLDLQSIEKFRCIFGVVDMIPADCQNQIFNAAIENTGPNAFDLTKWEAYRAQLAAYFIGIALENAKMLTHHNKTWECQKFIGILHYGLTPIFYKTEIYKTYLDKLKVSMEKDIYENLPEVQIEEFTPVRAPFADREIIYKDSRKAIFSCYAAFSALCRKYASASEL